MIISACAIAVLAFGLYVRTLHPGVGPSLDSIELQIAVLVQGIIHPPGSPQYLVLGRLASLLLPGPGTAYRLNLFSAICGAAAIGLTFLSTYRLTENLVVSSFAGLSLAVAPRVWYQSSITELYALNALYVSAFLYLFLSWHVTRRAMFFWVGVVIYALSFGNHQSMILLLPAFLYIVTITDRRMLFQPRHMAITIGIVIIAALQYLYIPLRANPQPAFCNFCPQPLEGQGMIGYLFGPILDYITGGPFRGAMFRLPRADLPLRLVDSIGQFNRQFLPWGYALGIIGIWELFQKRVSEAWFLILGIVAQYLFVLGYKHPGLA